MALMRLRFRLVRYSILFGCAILVFVAFREIWNAPRIHDATVVQRILWRTDSLCVSQSDFSNLCGPDEHTFNYSRSVVSKLYLRQFIHASNSAQSVRNEDIYGKLPSPREPDLPLSPNSVFVIQVHSRLENLRILIESLRQVKYIESSLLVFSSDFLTDDFFRLVDSVTFARTVKIFFPHSTQVFPDCFPGQSSTDCTGKRLRISDSIPNCPNALWVDKYDNYRNSSFSQVKHHWLWKVRFVFHHLVALSKYSGTVIFLEEDHYVTQDILHILRLLEYVWNPTEARGLLVLGSYVKDQTYNNEVHTDYWVSSKHNLGIGISRAIWNIISACLDRFCHYDDYNWDFSLHHIGLFCFPGRMKVLHFPSSSRVYHLGDCEGIHHRIENCSTRQLVWKLTSTLSSSAFPHLFPERLNIHRLVSTGLTRFRVNGGWNDPRDHALCESIAANRWNDSLLMWAPHLTAHSPIF